MPTAGIVAVELRSVLADIVFCEVPVGEARRATAREVWLRGGGRFTWSKAGVERRLLTLAHLGVVNVTIVACAGRPNELLFWREEDPA